MFQDSRRYNLNLLVNVQYLHMYLYILWHPALGAGKNRRALPLFSSPIEYGSTGVWRGFRLASIIVLIRPPHLSSKKFTVVPFMSSASFRVSSFAVSLGCSVACSPSSQV